MRSAAVLLAVAYGFAAEAQQLPADAAQALKPYAEFRAYTLQSWHPNGREMLVTRREGAREPLRVDTPGAAPRPLALEGRVLSAAFQPVDGESIVYLAEGSDGSRRLHLHMLGAGTSTPVSPADEEATEFSWSVAGDRLVYATVSADPASAARTRTTLRVVEPTKPASERLLGRLEGRWKDIRLAANAKSLALVQEVSTTESHLWVMDLPAGTRRRVTRPEAKVKGTFGNPAFSKDGRSLFALSDRGSEFRRLVLVPLAGGAPRTLTAQHAYDVDAYAASDDAGLLAFVTNEGGSHVMRFIDLVTLKEQPRPPLFDGVIGGLAWKPKSREVAFQVSSARTAGDVFSYESKSNQVTRWTNGNATGVNVRDFAEPQRIKWKSHDGRDITGLLYAPSTTSTGKRPVIVDWRSGAGSQWRTGFLGRANYVVGDLGVAIIRPNVRGSTGFGKAFASLPAGGAETRKDIDALLEWIGRQPGLDAARTLVIGAGTAGQPDDDAFLAAAVDFARQARP
jgi:dipeptidyl aminopeptidase/acylaminoacyl peptidase